MIPRVYAQKTTAEPSLVTEAVGNGAINVGTLTYDQLMLNNVNANVTLDHGVIQLSPLTSTVYGGQKEEAVTAAAVKRRSAGREGPGGLAFCAQSD